MSQARLNHYMMFSVYKEHVDALDLHALAREFVLRYPKRESIFEIPINTLTPMIVFLKVLLKCLFS